MSNFEKIMLHLLEKIENYRKLK
uniref:Uncharacterized protein n=1 Tax=Rhizophora mucronata TaxID=61149 RepID=A0A2P2NN41_RHIMU